MRMLCIWWVVLSIPVLHGYTSTHVKASETESAIKGVCLLPTLLKITQWKRINNISVTVGSIKVVLQLFCSQDCFIKWKFGKCQNRKRDIIQPSIYRILPKVNQVIYTLDKLCMPNMILAQAVPQIHAFCSKGSIWLQCKSWKRGKKNRGQLIFMLIPYTALNFKCDL